MTSVATSCTDKCLQSWKCELIIHIWSSMTAISGKTTYTCELNDNVLSAHLADTLNVTKSDDGLFTADFDPIYSAGLWEQFTSDASFEVSWQLSSLLLRYGLGTALCKFFQEHKKFCHWLASIPCIAALSCDATTTLSNLYDSFFLGFLSEYSEYQVTLYWTKNKYRIHSVKVIIMISVLVVHLRTTLHHFTRVTKIKHGIVKINSVVHQISRMSSTP